MKLQITRRELLKSIPVIATAVSSVWSDSSGFFPPSQTPEEFRKKKKFSRVLGSRMAYYQTGKGDPIVFLHGNPTSSYLWRNVIPHVAKLGNCIAPDLIGMGDSDKLSPSNATSYRFSEHYRYLEELLRSIGVKKNVTLVLHDWGGSLGFEWASRNAAKVKGIVFMETFIVSQNAQNTPPQISGWFKNFHTPEREKEVLENNFFVEQVLLRQFPKMAEEDKAEYRRPFLRSGEDRRPTITFPREVPLDGEPKEVHDRVSDHLEWMSKNEIPKLFVKGEPGGLIQGGRERVCRAWRNLSEISVKGNHYLPEESPNEIGKGIANWMAKV